MLAPIAVTDNRDGRVMAGGFLCRQKCAASRQLHAEHGEIVRSDECSKRAARIAFLAEAHKREIETHYIAENWILLVNIEIARIRKTAEFLRIFLVLRKELHHFVRLGISGRSKEKGVYHAKHGRVH